MANKTTEYSLTLCLDRVAKKRELDTIEHQSDRFENIDAGICFASRVNTSTRNPLFKAVEHVALFPPNQNETLGDQYIPTFKCCDIHT